MRMCVRVSEAERASTAHKLSSMGQLFQQFAHQTASPLSPSRRLQRPTTPQAKHQPQPQRHQQQHLNEEEEEDEEEELGGQHGGAA